MSYYSNPSYPRLGDTWSDLFSKGLDIYQQRQAAKDAEQAAQLARQQQLALMQSSAFGVIPATPGLSTGMLVAGVALVALMLFRRRR